YATALKLAGVPQPKDRIVDGVDLSPILFGSGPSPRRSMFYYRGTRLMAVRKGPWKAHFITQPGYGGKAGETHDPPLLYHLEHDPGETTDLAKDHADAIEDIRRLVMAHRAQLTPVSSQLEIPLPKR
ncbi:MAG: arylsulfatase, partial [Planctomycetaceae bacterium]